MNVSDRPEFRIGSILRSSAFVVEWLCWRLVVGASSNFLYAAILALTTLPISAFLHWPFLYLAVPAFFVPLIVKPHRYLLGRFDRRMRSWGDYPLAQWELSRVRSTDPGLMRRLREIRPAGVVWVAAAAAIAVVLGYALVQYLQARDHLKNPARVAFILNIPDLPSSVRDIECSARAITDLIVSCAFSIDPADYPRLLTGWDFRSEGVSGNGRAYGMDAPVGLPFEAVARHIVYPTSFKHGGLVDLVTNRDHSLVVVNRFEE